VRLRYCGIIYLKECVYYLAGERVQRAIPRPLLLNINTHKHGNCPCGIQTPLSAVRMLSADSAHVGRVFGMYLPGEKTDHRLVEDILSSRVAVGMNIRCCISMPVNAEGRQLVECATTREAAVKNAVGVRA